MQHDHVLFEILKRIDNPGPEALFFSSEETAQWPKGVFELLQRQGILKPATPTKKVECPGCEENCFMPVYIIPGEKNRPARFFISCDKREDIGRIDVDPVRLQRWHIDVAHFVTILADKLSTGHSPEEILQNKVYYLGNITLNQKKRSAFFVRNLLEASPESNSHFGTNLFRQCPNPLFLAGGNLAESKETEHGQAISLRGVLLFSDNGLSLDIEALKNLTSIKDERQDVVSFSETNIFRLEGQKWSLKYKGQRVYCNNIKGFLYISYLLTCPEREFHCQSLVAAAHGRSLEETFGLGGIQSTTEATLGDTGVSPQNTVLDDQALREYKTRINELRQLIDKAKENRNFVRKEHYQNEYEVLRKEVINATDIRGQARNAPDDAEKARKSVSEAVRRALKIIKKEHLELFSHLENSIRMGEYLSYFPEKETVWITYK